MKRLISIIVSCLFLSAATLVGQGDLDKLEEALRAYQQLEVLSMDIEAHGFADESDIKGEKVMSGAMRLNKDKYYSKMDGIELIVVGEKMTTIDHDEKTITLGRSKPVSSLKQDQPLFAMDSVFAHGGQGKYLGKQQGNDVYSIEIPNSLVRAIELHINAQNLIAKMVYYYQSMPELESAYYKMEVRFNNISQQPPSNKYFDEKKYIASRQSKIASAAYQGYTVEEVDYSTYQY